MFLSRINHNIKKAIPLKLVVIFVLFTLGIIVVGFYYYMDQRKMIFTDQKNDLAAIASMKLGQIGQWREEMLQDAEIIRDNELLVNTVRQCLESKELSSGRDKILKWLELVYKEFDGSGASIVDTSLNVLFTVSPSDSITNKYIKYDLVEVLNNNKVIVTDLHRTGIKKNYVIDLLIPLIDFQRKDHSSFAAVIVRIDLKKTLIPIIESWPTTSISSETLIVCRDADSVLYINNMRYLKDTSVQIKLPVSNENLLASKAVRGISGVVEGVDYRNIPVVGYITGIPDIPWYLIAKVNKEELQAPLRRLFYFVTIVIVLLVMINAAIIGFSIWEQEVKSVDRENAERKRAEDEIRNLNSDLEKRVIQRTMQLEASNKELEAFSYSVSHDLRSPLRSINAYTSILVEDYKNILDDEGKRLCGVISSSATQMGELIDDLLSFSRIGKCDLNLVLIEMDSLVALVFEDNASKAEKSKITLKIGNLHEAYADPTLIRVVWNNLISNAIKYSSKKASPHISIGSELEDGMIKYWVKDNGVGFEMKYSHKLFGVFQRLHSESEFEGNGVGLAIVHRIISRHNGKVWAEGEIGKGATFFFSLPADIKKNTN